MTPERLSEIETRLDGATKGEWCQERVSLAFLSLQDIPDLIAEVRRLQREVQELEPYKRAWHRGAGSPP